MLADWVIQNGQLITPDGIIEADLAVENGKIAAIGAGLSAKQAYDARGCLVLPGGVDVHVHPQMPFGEETTGDNWRAASLAAAYGGTTTLIDFVEPLPDEPLLHAFERRLSLIRPQACVDYSLHMTIASAERSVLNQIPAVVEQGIPSFKLYTTYAGFALDDEGLLKAFQQIQSVGGLALVHAENDAILRWNLEKLTHAGTIAPRFYPLSRPASAEIEAVQRALWLAHEVQARLYFVHLTTPESLAAVQKARQRGWSVFAETCPQYLLLNDAEYAREDALRAAGFVCAPPLRSPAEQSAIWQYLANGTVSSIGSDHCAFRLRDQKARGRQDFRLAPPGLPGVEARLSLIYAYGVCSGKLSLTDWVNLCCTRPAQIFGLYPRKGCLNEGSDADLVIFDPHIAVRLTSLPDQIGYRLHEGIDYSPYEGWEVRGWPKAVFLRGQPIVTNFQPNPARMNGFFLPRLLE